MSPDPKPLNFFGCRPGFLLGGSHMHLRHKNLPLALASVALVLTAAAAFAQTTPDPVNLGVTTAGHGRVRLTVTAGPGGAPDGFEVCYMPTALFASLGGVWPAVGWAPGEGWVDYIGIGTLNTWGSAQVDFKLAPNQALDIEIGDASDETGVSGTTASELTDATSYVVCAYAMPAVGGARSPLSTTLSCQTTPQGGNCTFTPGYWKNHTSAWPLPSLTLGTVSYDAAQLLTILNKRAAGNGLVSLARQLIATKLNIAMGALSPTILGSIAAADGLIGGLVVPPVGAGFISPGTTSGLTETLDDFNEGEAGSLHCGSTPVRVSTWGSVKRAYR
jgi:hypothetical protein